MAANALTVRTNERSFRLALSGAGREVPGMHLLFQKRIGLEALRRVVLKTPVDTGRARGTWQAGAATNEGLTGRIDPGGGGSISAGTSAINRIRTPFGAIFVFSNLAYIVPLEDGHSGQAPQGMVGVTVLELRTVAEVLGRSFRFRASRPGILRTRNE